MEWHDERDEADVEQDNGSGEQMDVPGVVLARKD